MKEHLLLVDASGFAHRAYHAYKPTYRGSDGMPTWAVIGFLQMLWKMLGAAQAASPTHGVAAFDVQGKNFRHKLFPDYKGNRPAARASELLAQLPLMRHAAETLGFYPLEVPGFEADDVIATLARRAAREGMFVTVVSSDKDFGQLVEDGRIVIVDPMAHKRIEAAEVEARWGVPPSKVVDVQALCGDAVDNIPGVPGCGEKRAAMLIRRFGSIEGVLKNTMLVKWPSVERELKRKDVAKSLRLYKKLVTLRDDVGIEAPLSEMKLRPAEKSHVMEILRLLEAAHRYDALFGASSDTAIVVSREKNPLAWWRAALAGEAKGELPADPQSGFYQRRLVRGGPWVPCRIWRVEQVDFVSEKPTENDVVCCEVDGKRANPMRQWDVLWQHPITKERYEFMVANAKWAKEHAPDEAVANPEKPIDWLREPV